MPLDKQELAVRMRLVARHKKQAFSATVVATDDGLRIRVTDGREYKSLSAAGSAITGEAVNGWRFWSLDGAAGQATTEEPEPTMEAPTAGAAKHRVIRRTPNQNAVPGGQVRWFCNACMGGFLAPSGATPEVCPQGHRAEPDGNGEVVTVSEAAETEDGAAVD